MKSNWKKLPFDEVIEDVSGGSKKIPQSSYLKSGCVPIVDQGKLLIAGFTDDPDSVCKSAPPVIVFGDHTMCFKYVDFPFAMGADGIKVLRPKIEADAKYLFYYLRHLKLPDTGYDRHFKYLKRSQIALPPLVEQRRIAAILDTADALRVKRRQLITKYDTLLRAVFLEMFGDPVKNPKGWPLITISSFVEAFQGGKSLLSDSNESPQFIYRVLKVSAVTEMRYKPEESKPVPSDYVPPNEHIVRSGDLLFSRANTTELVGAVAYVWNTPENILLPDKLWRFVWSKPQSASPLFVWSLFQIPSFRYELGKRATGTSGSMKNISQEKLLAMKVPFPELKLQQQFASIVESVQRVQKAHAESNRIMDNLFYSIQQRAFTGKLFAEKAAAR